MEAVNQYQIEIQGQAEESDLHFFRSLGLTVAASDGTCTQLEIHTDQSGLIGLLRHLHSRCFVLLSVIRRSTKDGE